MNIICIINDSFSGDDKPRQIYRKIYNTFSTISTYHFRIQVSRNAYASQERQSRSIINVDLMEILIMLKESLNSSQKKPPKQRKQWIKSENHEISKKIKKNNVGLKLRQQKKKMTASNVETGLSFGVNRQKLPSKKLIKLFLLLRGQSMLYQIFLKILQICHRQLQYKNDCTCATKMEDGCDESKKIFSMFYIVKFNMIFVKFYFCQHFNTIHSILDLSCIYFLFFSFIKKLLLVNLSF